MQNNSINRYGNPNATQGFIWKEITWLPGLLEIKDLYKVVSFSALFFMFTLTWITEKELERVIENKGDEFRRKKNMGFDISKRFFFVCQLKIVFYFLHELKQRSSDVTERHLRLVDSDVTSKGRKNDSK